MAALTPVTDEEFRKIATEEGVPLSVAYGIWGPESSAGTSQAALIDPRLRAGKDGMNTDYTKIGYGTMQVIEGTFNDVMPGKDYLSATDADLTRAGMRVAKRAVNADGTVDFQKLKNTYFGTGADKSFNGKRTATDPSVDSKMRRIMYAIENPKDPSMTGQQIALAVMNDPNAKLAEVSSTTKVSIADAKIQAASDQADALSKFDPVAAQAKYDEAQRLAIEKYKAIADREVAGQARVGDVFGVNPYGIFAEGERIAEELKRANARAERATQGYNFELKPANDGIMGVLETFAARVDGRVNGKLYNEQAKQAATRASDYATVVNQMAVNAARMTPSLKDQIDIDKEARAAGAAALTVDFKAIDADNKQARLELSTAKAEALEKNREYTRERQRLVDLQRTVEKDAELAQKEKDAADRYNLQTLKYQGQTKDPNVRAAINNARILRIDSTIPVLEARLEIAKTQGKTVQIAELTGRITEAKANKESITTYGTDDLSAINKAANIMMNTPDKVWSLPELKLVLNGDKAKIKQLNDLIVTGGDTGVLRNPNAKENIIEMQTSGSPSEREIAGTLRTVFDTQTGAAEAALLGITGSDEATLRNGVAAAKLKLNEKQAANLQLIAQERAKNVMAGSATPETNMQANPLNVHPIKEWIDIAGKQGGLAETAKAIGATEDPKVIGDAQLITKLIYAEMTDKLPVEPTKLKDQLLSYYKEVAKLRTAPDSIPYKLNFPMKSDQYIIEAANKKQYDLTKSVDLLRYMEVVKKNITARTATPLVPNTDFNIFAPGGISVP